MVFVFWQGIISIHQKAFLEALALKPQVAKVLVVVEEEITAYRKNMGWEVPVFANIEIKVGPTQSEIEEVCSKYKDAVHVMGGIRVGKMISAAFEVCMKHNCRVGIMTEPYNRAGFKGLLRTLKYQYYRLRYFRHIHFILAIGRQCVSQYKDLGYDARQIFPWAYFMTLEPKPVPKSDDSEVRRIIYAGRLEEAKGIARFTEALINTKAANYVMDIYGAGPDEERMKAMVAANALEDRIRFFPFLKYEELLRQYAKYNWVVLPSTQKDGWGVIVSEGLLNGLKAICSSMCGVSWAIKEDFNGAIFDWEVEHSCRSAIDKMLNGTHYAEPEEIGAWAEGALSGRAGADYFLNINSRLWEKGPQPAVPWLK